MKKSTLKLLSVCLLLAVVHSSPAKEPGTRNGGWISLFDGKTLNGWKASENRATFSVWEGTIVADGPRSHLFYVGPVADHDFANFEFRVDAMTMPKANSGIFFHTEYQEKGSPQKGYEVQINNTYPRRRGYRELKKNRQSIRGEKSVCPVCQR